MGASILWEMVDPNPRRVKVGAPSEFVEAMSRAGYRLPCHLDKSDIPMLRGMAAVFRDGEEIPNPYRQLVEILEGLEDNESIKVWSEY